MIQTTAGARCWAIFIRTVGVLSLAYVALYTFHVWSSLHEQGIKHLWIILALSITGPLAVMPYFLCFLGSFLLDAVLEETGQLSVKAVVASIIGTGIGFIAPSYLVASLFIFVVWAAT